MGIFNFSTLVFLINNWASIISKSPIWSMLNFWPDPHLFKSPGPKTPFGPFIVTPYNFGLLAQSIAQSENNFLGPNLLLGLFVTLYKFGPYGPVRSNKKTIFWARFQFLVPQGPKQFWAYLGLWAQSH